MNRSVAFSHVADMEGDVKDVRCWAGILAHMADSANGVESGELHVISGVLFELGERLTIRWDQAFEAARDGL